MTLPSPGYGRSSQVREVPLTAGSGSIIDHRTLAIG